MLRYLGHRLLQILVLLFVFITLTYFILQAMPGDFTSIYASNPQMTPEMIANLQARFGLNESVWVQYVRFLRNIVTGDLGVSFSEYPRPVWDIIKERLPRTFVLFFSANIISFYIGFWLGKWSAWYKGRAADKVLVTGSISLITAFYPLVAFMALWVFSYHLGWLPLNNFVDPILWSNAPLSSMQVFGYIIYAAVVTTALLILVSLLLRKKGVAGAKSRWIPPIVLGLALLSAVALFQRSGLLIYVFDILYHLLLPLFVLTFIRIGSSLLLTRDAVLAVTQEDYVLAARARGLAPAVIRNRYLARNAIHPVVTSLALSLGESFSGGVVTETLFSWPGIGLTLLRASLGGDYPLAVGAFIITGIFLLLGHVAADIATACLDPRLRDSIGR
ncbi:MAG TPA: ABC transporter permease [Firmicutes bacterium]|nr:ABC transporter permease [Bacillota bacterium]